MRPRQYFLIRAWLLFITAIISPIFMIILSFTTDNLTFWGGLGAGVFVGLLFFTIGMINYYKYQEDLEVEIKHENRIHDLEKELDELKNKNV